MFHSARIKLTAWYLLIIMSVSFSFSTVIYKVINAEIDRFALAQRTRIQRLYTNQLFPPEFRPRPVEIPTSIDNELAEEIHQRLVTILLLVNGGILVISGAVGYFLAGRTLAPIKDMVDDQKRFISDASHELKTPITSLKSAVEVALRDKTLKLKAAKSVISDSLEDINKLQVLTESLLALSRYEDPGNGHYKFSKVAVNDIIDKAVLKLRSQAKTKNISVRNLTENVVVQADTERLLELATILIDNAIKYSRKGGLIEISSRKADRFIYIDFEDHGIGIEEKGVPHIFDRFYRADTARTHIDAGGYGLGLSIAKKIVESHNGSISVRSKLEIGTKFTVKLPLKQNAA
jgi:two-component system, OmpR family, sensor histidine kinase CiaH